MYKRIESRMSLAKENVGDKKFTKKGIRNFSSGPVAILYGLPLSFSPSFFVYCIHDVDSYSMAFHWLLVYIVLVGGRRACVGACHQTDKTNRRPLSLSFLQLITIRSCYDQSTGGK